MDDFKTKPNYKRFDYTLAAGEAVELTRHCNQITCLESGAPFKMRLDDAPETDFEAGLSLRDDGYFSKIQIRNHLDISNRISLGLSKGQVNDARANFTGQVEVADEVGNSFGQVIESLEDIAVKTQQSGGYLNPLQDDVVIYEKTYSSGGSSVAHLIIPTSENVTGIEIDFLSLSVITGRCYIAVLYSEFIVNDAFPDGQMGNFEKNLFHAVSNETVIFPKFYLPPQSGLKLILNASTGVVCNAQHRAVS